jgi:arsenite-transporting ATPase
MTLNDLSHSSFQFLLFGGKGGVGKTTMAVTTALQLAKEKKVLIFTTDPAPSLGDSLGQAVGGKPTAIANIPNLFAMEINTEKALKEFKDQYGNDIVEILQQGTYLEDGETEEIFQLDIPGLDELMSLKKITDFMESTDYQVYIIDTAPTGHTLRLLLLPELLDNWIKFLATMRWKYHAMSRQLTKEDRIGKADDVIFTLKRTVKRVNALLQNRARTEFVVVTIAEKMAIAETKGLLQNLESMHIPTRHIIINNIFPQEDTDFARLRRNTQAKYINEMKEKFSHYTITEVVLQPTEIQGVESLQKLGAQLFSGIEGDRK